MTLPESKKFLEMLDTVMQDYFYMTMENSARWTIMTIPDSTDSKVLYDFVMENAIDTARVMDSFPQSIIIAEFPEFIKQEVNSCKLALEHLKKEKFNLCRLDEKSYNREKARAEMIVAKGSVLFKALGY